jgi:hypothetical protein
LPLEQERTKTVTRRSPAAKPAEKRAGAPRKRAAQTDAPTTTQTVAPTTTQADAPIPAQTEAPITSQADAPIAPCAADPLERRRLIEEAAYFRAERRGFAAGAAEQDWLDAEAEVDAQLAASAPSGEPPAPRAPRRAARSAPGKASS